MTNLDVLSSCAYTPNYCVLEPAKNVHICDVTTLCVLSHVVKIYIAIATVTSREGESPSS